jgi:UDP-2-acetamido-3-amino-2,3-dideoxy-glucuronate N-acetyltransferase
MNDQNKFIAQIGLGYWGKNILRNLYELGVLHTACDSSSDIIAERRKTFPHINYTSSPGEILEASDIHAVVIAAPAAAHYELVKKSLLAGKDVYVEKPLSLTVKEGEELVTLAEEKSRILMVGHILQFHPAVVSSRR